MNTLNIILLSCSVAVTVAQKVGDTSNDIIDGQSRSTGGYGLLRPGLQGGYNQGGYNQNGYSQGGYNQNGYSQGGYNQGGYSQGGYNPGYNGYNNGYGGAQGGYGGYQGYGQGYGGNQGYGGGAPGLYPGAGQGGYPGGYGGKGGYGGRFGNSPSGFGPGLPGYSGSGNRPYKPGFDYNRNGFPELEYPGPSQYRPYIDQPISTPYNYHTGTYPTAYGNRYKYSDNIKRYLGRKVAEIQKDEEES